MQQIHSLVHRLHNPDFGILLIRVALAMVFIYAGWNKLQNIEMVLGFFASAGISPFWTYVAVYTEVIGGILMLLGLFTRKVGALFAVVMIVALVKVNVPQNGYDISKIGYEVVLLLASLAMVFLGAGRYSLAKAFGRWCDCH